MGPRGCSLGVIFAVLPVSPRHAFGGSPFKGLDPPFQGLGSLSKGLALLFKDLGSPFKSLGSPFKGLDSRFNGLGSPFKGPVFSPLPFSSVQCHGFPSALSDFSDGPLPIAAMPIHCLRVFCIWSAGGRGVLMGCPFSGRPDQGCALVLGLAWPTERRRSDHRTDMPLDVRGLRSASVRDRHACDVSC